MMGLLMVIRWKDCLPQAVHSHVSLTARAMQVRKSIAFQVAGVLLSMNEIARHCMNESMLLAIVALDIIAAWGRRAAEKNTSAKTSVSSCGFGWPFACF